MTLYTNFLYPTEIHDVVKLFLSDVVLSENTTGDIKLMEYPDGDSFQYVATFFAKVAMTFVDTSSADELHKIRLRKRYAKLCIYELLVKVTGKQMPWGSLTGIRPTKLARQLQGEGLDWQQTFTELLGVSNKKTQLVADILAVQGNLTDYKEGVADLYIGVPFCVSRCSYCSFTSGEIARLRQYVEPYVDVLIDDITCTISFARNNNITLQNVYIGGGTPTSLSAAQLDRILSAIDFEPVEFTVEAGRPDTIDENKLRVFAEHGVHRVSINPQTFNQSVLDVIGRKHTVQDIFDKYKLAKKFGFEVNMDLIAGLPSETYEMFCYSVNKAIELQPENITIHTLALKRGSSLVEQHYVADEQGVAKMVDYSHASLYDAGYVPYYMYRQKYMQDNLENVGFCKQNKPCLYNIGIMEESSDILACGTNAISKRIIPALNRIERAANAKDVITYIQRNHDYIEKRFRLFLDSYEKE